MGKLLIPVVLTMLATTVVAASQVSKNLLPNPGFEQGLKGWETAGQAEFTADSEVSHSGKQSARITASLDQTLEWQQVGYSLPVKPGEEYNATFWVRGENLMGGVGTYGAIEFWRDDERLSVIQSFPTRSEKWHQLGIEAVVPKEANLMRLALISYAFGTAWFDDVRLSHPEPQPAQAAFVLQPNKLITDQWQGFGFQGDLFLHRQRVTDQGVVDDDRALVRRRIKAMRPQIVRLMFNLTDWEAERGKRTPDSEGMKDLRETLAIYKEIGADIQLTEWGFGVPSWGRANPQIPDPADRKAFTDSFTAAVKYLREECGFKNIRYVTIYNEPNGFGIPVEDYAAIYRSLDESLKTAELRNDVAILGPDEANAYDWLPWSIAELNDVIDYYDAHNYTCDSGMQFGRWVAPRTADMPKVQTVGLQPQRKRLMITEFGMHNSMETFSTPHNGKYEYGFFLADCAIEAANKGASALMMWCLMDTDYGQRMKWGLWKFKDEDWEPRPGFYSWSLLARYTEKDSTVHPLVSNVSDAAAVAFRAPKKGAWTLLVANRKKIARQFTMTGLKPGSRWEPYIYSKESVPTSDCEMIRPGKEQLADSTGKLKGTLPARSFVLWHEVVN